MFTKDKINSHKILPTGVTVFEPAALSGGGIWKKIIYFNITFYNLEKDNILTIQLSNRAKQELIHKSASIMKLFFHPGRSSF